MLADYLAIVAASDDPEKMPGPDKTEWSMPGPELEHLFSNGRLTLLATPGTPAYRYPDGSGCLIGIAFDRQTGRRLGDDRGQQASYRDTRAMLAAIWGTYVSFQIDAAGKLTIMRDPSAGLPCYYVERDKHLIFSSDARRLALRHVSKARIDWHAVAAELLYPDLRPAQTCLAGISELLPGEATVVEQGRADRSLAWSPHIFASAPPLAEEMAEAAAQVGETALAGGRAWAGAFDHVLLNLSGGLDSSILAATLAAGGASLSCLTLVSSAGQGDERSFATLVADHLGLPLFERFPDAAGTDITRSAAANLPRPSARSYTQQIGQVTDDLATVIGAEALIYGGGGDNVFCYLHSANPAADRLRVEGLGRGFLRTIQDLAEITGCSSWEVARSAWSKRKPTSHWSWPEDASLLTSDAVRSATPPDHPWLKDIADLPPGKREHITAIMRAHGVIDYLNQESVRPTLYPLLSQPLMECCLRYPTWLWCDGGVNRAIARQAFADHLPAAVINRHTKGGFSGLARRIYVENLTAIGEMILDGELCRRGIVHRTAVEAALDNDPTGVTPAHIRILRIADVEAWIAAQGST